MSIQVEGQLFELEQLQHQLPLLEQATAKLETLVGSSLSQLDYPQAGSRTSGAELPSAEPLSARLEAAVESASLVAAELQSIHRQHITTGLLLQQEEVKAKQLEADLAQTKVSCATGTGTGANICSTSCFMWYGLDLQ